MTASKPRKTTRKHSLAPALPAELPVSALRRNCDPASLGFRVTDELPDLQEVIGQPRALRALELGSEIPGTGYNIFVLGMPGSGRTTLSKEYLERKAATESVPDDWCYVNNFSNPTAPKALRLPAGKGMELKKDLQELVLQCAHELPRVFESEEYVRERDRLMAELKKSQEAEFKRLEEYVGRYKFLLARTSFGFVLVPAIEGKPLKGEEIEKLSPEVRSKLEQIQVRLSEEVEKTLNRLREMERQTTEQLRQLNASTALFFIRPLVDELKAQYAHLDAVRSHFEAIQTDMIELISHIQLVRANHPGSSDEGWARADWLQRYGVNVLVNNAGLKGAPVVVEMQPTYQNLLGRIEHEYVMGASRTDFTRIRAGALHRANGGYLILPARDLLINLYAWEGLKRALRDGHLRISELANQLGLISTVTLEPEPIPLRVKVVLVGTPLLYYLLNFYDEDFAKLFKVRAEFATFMERNPQTENEYGLFVKSVVLEHGLPSFDATAVARVIEHSSRLAEDQHKLSTRFGKIADLVREAAYWAKKEGQQIVSARDVQRAIEESRYRSNLTEERLRALVEENVLLIDVKGKAIGQINALSILFLGDYAFGRASRVTASAYPGRAGVVDIERQAKLGGSIHTKGVLIIGGFLGDRFGRSGPLSLSASLTFEQSYDEVEGDSASAAELLALLSAIAGIPLRQDRAITGSVNQHGQIQAIGGVNEKIEGFYAACLAKGLTGEGGVIIPKSNVRHLMLSEEVIEAVKAGRFHIWAIETVDEAIELLTGYPSGELGVDQTYPPGTFNRAVADRLAAFAKTLEAAPREVFPAVAQEEPLP